MSLTMELINLDGGNSFTNGCMDVSLSPKGSFFMLEGVDAVAQAFEKAILSKSGCHFFNVNYGSRARDLVGAKLLGNITVGLFASMIQGVLKLLAGMQKKMMGIVPVPPSEQIVGMKDVTITFAQQGSVIVQTTIQTQAGEVSSQINFPEGQLNV